MLDCSFQAPPPACETRVCGGGQWVCFATRSRRTRWRGGAIPQRAPRALAREAFTPIERAAAGDDAERAAMPMEARALPRRSRRARARRDGGVRARRRRGRRRPARGRPARLRPFRPGVHGARVPVASRRAAGRRPRGFARALLHAAGPTLAASCGSARRSRCTAAARRRRRRRAARAARARPRRRAPTPTPTPTGARCGRTASCAATRSRFRRPSSTPARPSSRASARLLLLLAARTTSATRGQIAAPSCRPLWFKSTPATRVVRTETRKPPRGGPALRRPRGAGSRPRTRRRARRASAAARAARASRAARVSGPRLRARAP